MKNKNARLNKFLLMLMLAGGVAYSLQGCGPQEERASRELSRGKISHQIISDEELAMLLAYSGTAASNVEQLYVTYSGSLASGVSRPMLLGLLKRDMKDYPELYEIAEEVFIEWQKKGKLHDRDFHYKGLWNVNAEIIRRYIDKNYQGRQLGIDFGVANQELAYLIVLAEGSDNLFHKYLKDYVLKEKR